MRAYQQLELMRMSQRHNDEERDIRRQYDADVSNIRRGLIIDGSSDQLFYHMTALRVVVCVLAGILAYLFSRNRGFGSFLLYGAIFSAVFLVVLNMARSRRFRDARTQVDDAIRQRDNRLKSDLAAMHARHKAEEKRLKEDIRKKMNAFGQQYCSAAYTTLLIDWLLNELSNEIRKADRSPFYPNVNTGISFEVTRDRICVPGGKSYNLSAQGIRISDDPLAVSALAKILGDNVQSRGSVRFAKDPAGGNAVVTCNWNGNTGVSVKYSAVNGNVGKNL